MNVLVTGANGHVGNNLSRALVERGHAVRASVRPNRRMQVEAAFGAQFPIDWVELDVRDGARLANALSGVEVLFHVATAYSLYTGSRERDDELVRTAVEGVENALRGAARQGVRKVVLTSSLVTLPQVGPGEPPVTERAWRSELGVPYFRAKVLSEQRGWELARELGVELVSVLPGVIGGPGFLNRTTSTDLFEGIMLGAMRFGAPPGNVPYVDIRDVIEGHVLAGEKAVSGRFILCNDEAPSMSEVIELMHRIDPTIPLAPRRIPVALLGILPALDGLAAKLLKFRRVVTPELLPCFAGRVWSASSARAQQELGWQPRVPIVQSLADMLGALRAMRLREGNRVPDERAPLRPARTIARDVGSQ